MPQILNSVFSLITSQTPSEYKHNNYDLTRLILDYQYIKWLSSEIQPSHTFVRKLAKQGGHQIILLLHKYLCFNKNVISYKMFCQSHGSHSETMKLPSLGLLSYIDWQTGIHLSENMCCLHLQGNAKGTLKIVSEYAGCYTSFVHNCRRWFPRSMWSKISSYNHLSQFECWVITT